MKSYWDENFSPKIENLRERNFEFVKNAKEYDLLQQRSNEYEDSKINYAINHRSFLYFLVCLGLFFSFILIIPFYWNLKKYKEMREIKDHFQNEINLAFNNLISAKKDWVSLINYENWIEEIYKLLSYKQMGPITQELVDLMNGWVPSDNPLSFNKNYNPFNTQWSIWNDRVIIINASKQVRETEMKTYSGSITVPRYYYVNGEPRVSYTTITAYYDHPYTSVYNQNITNFAFMQSCTDLNFYPTKKSNKHTQLENPEFNKICGWEYNNPVQFRMIFTPSKQESFVNEYIANNHMIAEEDYLWKTSNFCYNDCDLLQNKFEETIHNCLEIVDDFTSNDSLNYDHFLNELWQTSELYTYSTYLSIKFLFTTPIFLSENQKTIINNSQTYNYFDYCPYFIWQNVLQMPIVKLDSECFNELVNSNKIFNTNINKSVMNGTSYKYIEKVINIKKSGHKVPVKYIDCIPTNVKFDTYYCPFDNSKIKLNSKFKYLDSKLSENAKNKIMDIVEEIMNNKYIIAIENGFIALTCESRLNKLDDYKIKDWINKIESIIKE